LLSTRGKKKEKKIRKRKTLRFLIKSGEKKQNTVKPFLKYNCKAQLYNKRFN